MDREPDWNQFEDLDPADFGEPTAETRDKFNDTLDKLKSLGSVFLGEPRFVLQETGIEDPPEEIINEMSDVAKYYYDQFFDADFPLDRDSFLRFLMFETDKRTEVALVRVLGEVNLVKIFFEDPEYEISYARTTNDETLYITEAISRDLQAGTLELNQEIIRRVFNRLSSISNGADRVTEGSLKKLTTKLLTEIESREQNQQD